MPSDATKGKRGAIPLSITAQYLKLWQAHVNNCHQAIKLQISEATALNKRWHVILLIEKKTMQL